jgi:hypothetical protein
MGRVESGEIAVGDACTVLPSAARPASRTSSCYGQSLRQAGSEQSVTLLLEDEIDISRGDMIVKSTEAPAAEQADRGHGLLAGGNPAGTRRKYWLRHTTRETQGARWPASSTAGHQHPGTVSPTAGHERHRQRHLQAGAALFVDSYTDRAHRRLHPHRRVDQQHRRRRDDRRSPPHVATTFACMATRKPCPSSAATPIGYARCCTT